MRVLHVLSSIDPKHGGPVLCVRNITECMLQLGSETEVLSLETPRLEWLSDWPALVHSVGGTAGAYRYCRGLTQWIRENTKRFDAVLVHGIWQYHSLGVWRVLRDQHRVPYHLFVHGMLDPWFRRAYPLKHAKKLIYWCVFESRVVRHARSVIFTTETELRAASTTFRPFVCEPRIVRMGTPRPPRGVASEIDNFYELFPELKGKRILLFLGRLHRVKGCDLLIRAFSKIAAEERRFHLLIAGPTEPRERSRLERLSKKYELEGRITWAGQMAGGIKWAAYRAAEVFALPSHTESYGQAIVEAMACGLPVLITNKVKIWPYVNAEDAGLVANDDFGGVVDLLSRWSQLGPERRRILSQNAFACYEKHFEMDGFVLRLMDVLAGDCAATESSHGVALL